MPIRPAARPKLGTFLATLMAAATLVGLTLSAGTNALATSAHARAHASATSHLESKPTIVLVHGAFADGSGWNDVTQKLQKGGYTVYAPANPLRGLVNDAGYIGDFLATIDGPIVLVGHSYGGAVITNAATGNPNVRALVYVAAYALDEGEALIQANELGGGHTTIAEHLVTRPYPGAPPGDADGYIDPAAFHNIFCADLPGKQAAVMAASQRGASLSSLFTPSGPPAWKTIPSWYLVASGDRTIPPEAERVMAERAGATTIEINSSHVAMMSHPRIVTDLILRAVRSQA
jgi:pimeloyl-ACP methyl ester carboxylesterase